MNRAESASPGALALGGIVLAGGRSSRMGKPKAWLSMGGKTMLEAVVAAVDQGLRLAADCSGEAQPEGGLPAPPLVVVGAPDQELPSLAGGITVVRDVVEGEGPLRGMEAGLEALQGRADAAYVSSCDTPLLAPAFVARLCSLLGIYDIAVPQVDDRHHPLAAVYRTRVLKEVRQLLANQRRRPFFLFERVKTRVVEVDEIQDADPGLRSLRNFNTPEEYADLIAGTPAGGDPV